MAAKAVDGEANTAVCELIANTFSVAKRSVNIIRGATSREKTLQIDGDPPQLVTTVGQILASFPEAPDLQE